MVICFMEFRNKFRDMFSALHTYSQASSFAALCCIKKVFIVSAASATLPQDSKSGQSSDRSRQISDRPNSCFSNASVMASRVRCHPLSVLTETPYSEAIACLDLSPFWISLRALYFQDHLKEIHHSICFF